MSDYDLKTSLKRFKNRSFYFALIKGEESNQVFVTSKPAKTKDLIEIIETCGGGQRIAKGQCLWEGKQLVFATKAAPAPRWTAIITKTFKAHRCNKFLPVVLRQLAENE
jgi:hypothetical protein